MMMRFDNIVSLPSGNTARNFRVNDLGNGRVRIQYVYTDRRRAHQVSRHFTAEFLNGRLQSITARSARGGRVETFSTSLIIDVLLEMLVEVNISNFRKDTAEMRAAETTETDEQDDTDLMNTVRLVEMGAVINLMVALVTLGIVWYNL